MINFTRAFDSAWERMMIILFRPFEIGKWFAIGFSAFLAGLLNGGNGINFNNIPNSNDFKGTTGQSTQIPSVDWKEIQTHFSSALAGLQLGMIIALVIGVFILIVALAVLIYWLGARGQFLFLDNVVRNRGAIAWPWTAYARLANSLFLFYLLLMLITIPIFLLILGVAVVIAYPLFIHQRWPVGWEIGAFVVLGIIYFVVAIAFAIIIFLFRELGVPLMFRNGILARDAFREVWVLVQRHPGSIALFVLLRIAIAIGLAVIGVIACCLTCCIAAFPYVGTVILLPALVYVRCFTLDFLAQFGPQYDVWTVDVPPGAAPLTMATPQPPPV